MVGLSNYLDILTDPKFGTSLLNTLFFVFVGMSVTVGIGMGLAMAVNSNVRGRTVARVAVVIPWVLCEVIVGLTWQWMFNDQFGLANSLLGKLGINRVSWLADPRMARISILIAVVWQSIAYSMLLIQAALQGISEELYCAARVDGASPWQCFIYMTLPLLRPTLMVLIIMVSLHRFNMFTLNMVLTGGGPGHATSVLGLYMYEQGFQMFNFGYGSAVAVIMFAINLVFTAVYIKAFNS